MKKLLLLFAFSALAFGQNIDWTQIKSSTRHGTNSKGQSSDGTGTSAHIAVYNSGGGLTDGPTQSTTVNGTTCTLGSTCTVTGGPTGSAGGDLSSTYPNPTVSKVNGVTYGSGPSTNTVPVVTGSNTVTYEAVPNAALANSAVTVNGTTCTLGSTCTPSGAGGITSLTGDATASGPGAASTTVSKVNGISYSATAAAHSVEVVTTANTTATAKVLPNCTDTAGNHLNYTQSTDAFSCGTSGATSGTTVTIASGTAAMGTSAIGSAACATVVTSSATGTLSTDTIIFTPNASIKALTGYTPATTGGLTIAAYPTADNANFDVCNWSTGSLTPSALTLNWRVVR